MLIQIIDIEGRRDGCAGGKNLIQSAPACLIGLLVHQRNEGFLEESRRFLKLISEVFRDDFSITILRGRRGSLEVKERRRSGKSSLENARVLKAKPCGKHAAIGTAKDDAGAIFHGILLSERSHQSRIIHHCLFNSQIN